nr:carbohydrate sulfotransferase 4 [Helicoverpa armigera]
MRRTNNYWLCYSLSFSFFLLLIIVVNQFNSNTYLLTTTANRKNIQIIIRVEDGTEVYTKEIPIVDEPNDSTAIGGKPIQNKLSTMQNDTQMSEVIEKILEDARTNIKNELSNYNFSHSGANVLEDLVMESGGQPQRTLIISSWRSGSTFFGDLIDSIPSSYYHYEPLLMFGIKQIRTPAEAGEALKIVKNMFKCNFEGLEEYFEFESKDLGLFSHSTRLWDYCKYDNKNDLCFNAEFTSRLCKLFPFQSMKLVRLRLRLVEEIIKDKDLNVKVILLTRDPRGLMQSRRQRHFCELSSDCWEPSLVCADMISDYVAAKSILQKYPDRLLVIRFEELVLEQNTTLERILNFLDIDARKAFNDFLQTHTNVEVAGVHSTFKVSRNIPFKWKHTLDFTYVSELQMACKEAMHLWGYKMAYNETHMKSEDFNPVDDYTIS